MVRRYNGPKRSKKLPKGYDSWLEVRLHDGPLSNWEVHTKTYEYIVEHTYHPDFILESKDKTFLIESKGRFQDMPEASKYVWIRKHLPPNTELIFIFERGNLPLPNAKKRKKCGTKRTHAEWAEKQGFTWFDEKALPELLTEDYL